MRVADWKNATGQPIPSRPGIQADCWAGVKRKSQGFAPKIIGACCLFGPPSPGFNGCDHSVAASLRSIWAGAVAGDEAVRSLYAASRSYWSAMISNPCRSHPLRHAFAWLRASFASWRCSSGLDITQSLTQPPSAIQATAQAGVNWTKKLGYRRRASVRYRSREASNVETTTGADVFDANIRGPSPRGYGIAGCRVRPLRPCICSR